VDGGAGAVDGTNPTNEISLAVTNQAIASWPAGAALWLVWEMTDPTGQAQGLAIDNLSFSASAQSTATNAPVLSIQGPAAGSLVISWPSPAAGYQLYSATNLAPPAVWNLVSASAAPSNGTQYLTILPTNGSAQFFRLMAP
jgi:hypothetical protein